MEGCMEDFEVELANTWKNATILHARQIAALELELKEVHSNAGMREQEMMLEARQGEEKLRLQVEALAGVLLCEIPQLAGLLEHAVDGLRQDASEVSALLERAQMGEAALRAGWAVEIQAHEGKLREQQAVSDAEVEDLNAQIRNLRREFEEMVQSKQDELHAQTMTHEAWVSELKMQVGQLQAELRRAHEARDKFQRLADEAKQDSARVSAEVEALEALADGLVAVMKGSAPTPGRGDEGGEAAEEEELCANVMHDACAHVRWPKQQIEVKQRRPALVAGCESAGLNGAASGQKQQEAKEVGMSKRVQSTDGQGEMEQRDGDTEHVLLPAARWALGLPTHSHKAICTRHAGMPTLERT